ncbi:cobalt-precorrin-5B (C(1))-methyltransferase CbiD [Prochlorococcus marinus]|uniref:Cobalt-precorrin-5B C(1)-methyltransferase n=1 Tax=Prochlorococcus marinus XMU1408 TaxID=2213228 RepID=A0A318R739_PROMR|nr:cobalt-precorrin-5B (C(1))-methyltransferase CbiD [Prochlorococcus marinus]MBW3042596.1 cobalt-precorrin-5B (C(1))-methyltransferase [Prochlorococcus marinus str. XMU1408]PYE03641.1 cobalt-precorrin-5B (C(1))-methyltransferase [Prochlorococcus marinus XMU1408]
MNEFTLPVWVVAAAKSAMNTLLGNKFKDIEKIYLPNKQGSIEVPICSSALLDNGERSLAVSHCQSGLSLDVTRGLEIWAYIKFNKANKPSGKIVENGFPEWLDFHAGYGVGKFESSGLPCISKFALDLLCINLYPLLPKDSSITVEVVLPEGKDRALKTSNKAFGVVDGLSLIGTQAEVQISASPEQLKNCIEILHHKCSKASFDGCLTFVIGENGMDLALKFGLPAGQIIKTGNWLGPLLVAAAENGVKKLLLFGYHGKLVKLSGGVFHTHHHLADGRLEILTSLAVREGISFDLIELISKSSSVENALLALELNHPEEVALIWGRMAKEIEIKSLKYVNRYLFSAIEIGTVLFDRKRQIRWAGLQGLKQINSLGLILK